jgi:hypothetical protein
MQKHLKTAKYLKSERGKRAEITGFLKNSVCLYIFTVFLLKLTSSYIYFANLIYLRENLLLL